jgi:hypothetical protein
MHSSWRLRSINNAFSLEIKVDDQYILPGDLRSINNAFFLEI